MPFSCSQGSICIPYSFEYNVRIVFFFSEKLRILIEFLRILLNKIWQKLRITFECGLNSSAGCFRRNRVLWSYWIFEQIMYFWNSVPKLTFDLAENKVMHFTITFGLHVTSPFNISTLLRSSFVRLLVGKKYELCIALRENHSTFGIIQTNWFSVIKSTA